MRKAYTNGTLYKGDRCHGWHLWWDSYMWWGKFEVGLLAHRKFHLYLLCKEDMCFSWIWHQLLDWKYDIDVLNLRSPFIEYKVCHNTTCLESHEYNSVNIMFKGAIRATPHSVFHELQSLFLTYSLTHTHTVLIPHWPSTIWPLPHSESVGEYTLPHLGPSSPF